jgi:SAM-dependent methyltransferase
VQFEIARRLARKQKVDSSFYLMNAENMDCRDPFDVIWVVAALTHFSDQKGFFKSAQRFLKENGNLIIYDWMIDDKINNPKNDLDIQRVTEEMVLAGMYSHDNYVQWLIETGYQMVFDSDITDKTIQTWDINFSLVKRPLIREFISAIAHDELKEIRTFLRARKSIKNAMLKGKVKSFALIAEKR